MLPMTPMTPMTPMNMITFLIGVRIGLKSAGIDLGR